MLRHQSILRLAWLVLAAGWGTSGTCAAQSPPQRGPVVFAGPGAAPAGTQAGQVLMAGYSERAERPDDRPPAYREPFADELPPGFRPWWQDGAAGPMRGAHAPLPVSAQGLVVRALRHSARVRVLQDIPLIQETAVTEAAAAFDASAFVDARWVDTSDPVGNLLTTGGPLRYRDDQFSMNAGLRGQNRIGGQWEFAQRYGTQTNNSQFFFPNEQGTARLSLSYTQPLWQGHGRFYNTSAILLAEIEAGSSMDEFARRLQDYLLEVHRAYWNLVLQREMLMQRRQLYAAGQHLLAELESRQRVDALQNQVLQARARVAQRYTTLVELDSAVRNAEAQIRALVNDPVLVGETQPPEILPSEFPLVQPFPVQLEDARTTALEHRPEIAMAMKSMRAAALRAQIAEHELKPRLDLVLESYVSGLRSNFGVGNAWVDQFREGEPSYTAGLVFEVPLGQHAAHARRRRRELEVRQLTNQFQADVENLMTEVEIAVRQTRTAYRQIQTTYRSMQAAASELRYLQERWRLSPDARESEYASVLLDNLLASQERLAEAEAAFARSRVVYSLSVIELKRAQGTLLDVTPIPDGNNGAGPPVEFLPPHADPARRGIPGAP